MLKGYATKEYSANSKRNYVPSCYRFSRMYNFLFQVEPTIYFLVNVPISLVVGAITYAITISEVSANVTFFTYLFTSVVMVLSGVLKSALMNKADYRREIYPIEVAYNKMPEWRRKQYKNFLIRAYKIMLISSWEENIEELQAIDTLFKENAEPLKSTSDSLLQEVQNEINITRESRKAL